MKTTLGKFSSYLFIITLIMGIVSCSSETTSELTKVTLRLNWTIYGEHAPFFVALDKGFYEEAGLDVEIIEGTGSATTVKLIGEGTNEFGYADSGTMMRGVSDGEHVKAVAVFTQINPMSVIYMSENPIPTAQDLKGKSIGITSGSATSRILPAVLNANNLSEDDVNLVSLSTPKAKEDALLNGDVDAFLGYFIDQPPRIEYNENVDLDWFKYSDSGINTLSSAIIINASMIEENPDLVKSFVEATQRGVRATLDNPQEAAESLSKHAEEFDVSLSLIEIELWSELLYTSNSKGHVLGWTAIDDWEDTLDILTTYLDFQGDLDVTTYFTNEFLADVE